MLQIQLPDNLLQEIEAAGVTGSAVDAFVQQAVREKLVATKLTPQERREQFFRLSDEMRAAMHEKGLTEEQILAEFDRRRHSS